MSKIQLLKGSVMLFGLMLYLLSFSAMDKNLEPIEIAVINVAFFMIFISGIMMGKLIGEKKNE